MVVECRLCVMIDVVSRRPTRGAARSLLHLAAFPGSGLRVCVSMREMGLALPVSLLDFAFHLAKWDVRVPEMDGTLATWPFYASEPAGFCFPVGQVAC